MGEACHAINGKYHYRNVWSSGLPSIRLGSSSSTLCSRIFPLPLSTALLLYWSTFILVLPLALALATDSFPLPSTQGVGGNSGENSEVGGKSGEDTQLPTQKDYAGYQLIRVVPRSEDHQATLMALLNNFSHSAEHVDFWRHSRQLYQPTEILVSPSMVTPLMKHLRLKGMRPRVQMADMGRVMEVESGDSTEKSSDHQQSFGDGTNRQYARIDEQTNNSAPSINLNSYQNYTTIMEWLRRLAAENPTHVAFDSLGQSSEGRELGYLKIGYPPIANKNPLSSTNQAAKPIFFLDAGIHAREWIAPAVALHFIDRLVRDDKLKPLLTVIDIYVLPSLNPDGYVYTFTKNRFWRKNRSPPPTQPENSWEFEVNTKGERGVRRQKPAPPPHCVGVDANRNFLPYWGTSGASEFRCSEVFAGNRPHSELETQALAAFLITHRDTIKAYVTLHSYSNTVVYPWSSRHHTYTRDREDLKRVGHLVSKAIFAAGGPGYAVGSGADVLYEASGTSYDFAKILGIKYAYLIELTNTVYGFALPSRYIEKTAKPLVEGLLVVAEEVGRFGEGGQVGG